VDQPNILLIGVDTLRADHLGCYGYARATSPNIDALARQGTLGEQFFCAGIPTHPSFTTLLTGQHPITHGIVAQAPKTDLAKEAPFLSRLFLEEGYTTCAVDNLGQQRLWFHRGFEYYIDPSLRHILPIDVTCEEQNARAIPWLRAHADEPFFMFIHYWDPHWPLTPPARHRNLFYQGNPVDPHNHALDEWWSQPLGQMARDTWLRRRDGVVTDPAYVEALYDQEIRHLDDGVGELLSALDDLGLAESTLVILLGDHGESMTEHRVFFDHIGLHDQIVHVPFIARWPGHIPASQRIPHLFQHHDVAPTLLQAADITAPDEIDGRSVWPQLTGAPGANQSAVVSCESTWQTKWSLRTDRHKLILSRGPDIFGRLGNELYDLVADPHEERNLIDEEPTLAGKLEAQLENWIAARLTALGRTDDPLRTHGTTLSFA